jgi:hypothetical protein
MTSLYKATNTKLGVTGSASRITPSHATVTMTVKPAALGQHGDSGNPAWEPSTAKCNTRPACSCSKPKQRPVLWAQSLLCLRHPPDLT